MSLLPLSPSAYSDAFYDQMENYFINQLDLCDHYKNVFEQQNNSSMANKFAGYSLSTIKYLELVKDGKKKKEPLPKFRFEQVGFNCLPSNLHIKDKELQLEVKTIDLPVSEGAEHYIVAEFAFPYRKENETMTDSFKRWLHHVKIEPNYLICCSSDETKQLDIIYPTNTPSFADPESKSVLYDRPISFFVDKGKSRTLRRKFKPIKLTIYEKTNCLRFDKKLGTVLVKVDSINDEARTSVRQAVMNGRKETEALVDIKIKIREPLMNKTIRNHEERLLFLV